jgi:predicted Zn finger-like uncharacterized protein
VSIQVTCPSCTASFKASDTAAGKQAKCPKCNGVIDIPIAAGGEEIVDAEIDATGTTSENLNREAASDDPAAAADRKPCPMCGEMIVRDAVKCRFCGEVLDRSMVGMLGGGSDLRDPGWKRTRSGLATVYYSLVIMLIAIILMIVGAMIVGAMGAAAGREEPPVAMIVLIVICGLTIFGSAIGMIVGQILCAGVPASSGARGFAIGAVLCVFANIFFSSTGGVLQVQAISSLGNLVSTIGWVLFILFIRRTAMHLGNIELAASAKKLLVLVIGIVVGMILGIVVGAIANVPAVVFIVIGLAVIAFIAAFFWYVRLITTLMATIDQRTATP